MGLDLTVSTQSDFRTDELGRNVHTVTQLANLRGCYTILDMLSDRLELGFSNCATHTFYGETFHEILEEMQEELTELEEYEEPTERNNDIKAELEYNIELLEEFIAANEVLNDDTQDYQVHAWW